MPSWSTASGQVRAAFAGRRGAAFAFSTLAEVTPDTIRLTGSGRIERQPLVLNQAAVLTRSGDGWQLAPTRLTFAGGTATVAGRSGSRPEVHALVQGMPLEALDIAWPSLDLSGSATGRLDYAWKGNRSGRIDLKVRGLSRAGLVLASKPIDLGIAAMVEGNNAAMRAVAASNGAVIGRAQARFAPMGGGPLFAELMNAPLFAQLRYVGPADTLWRLSGTETLDLSGPIAVGADIGGRLADPSIRGSLRTQSARLESPVTGMVIDQVQSQARFSGPQLIFTQISGRTAGGGSVSGTGSVTFSGGGPRSTCRSRQPGAAAQPRRYRRAGDRPAADPFRRAGRDDFGRPEARQRALPARPGERRGERAAAPGRATAASNPRTSSRPRTSTRGNWP